MSDIVERLRNREGFVLEGPRRLMQACEEAATEIDRLRAELAAAQELQLPDASDPATMAV